MEGGQQLRIAELVVATLAIVNCKGHQLIPRRFLLVMASMVWQMFGQTKLVSLTDPERIQVFFRFFFRFIYDLDNVFENVKIR